MSQSTPTAATKRKVMGRMDTAPAESPSSSVTPNARPRIVRAHHGYSSPSLSNNTTPTASRPTPGTGRARVDMSAFASPSSAAASNSASSPSVSGRPTTASSTISARLSAPSPSMRSTATMHSRSGSTVGVSASSYKLAEARMDPPVDANLASLRSPKVRARNGSVDLSGSPSINSPSTRLSASSQLASSISLRSPVPRADQTQFSKPSTPSASVRPAPTIPARHLLSPQRSQESIARVPPRSQSRSPSPVLPAATVSHTGALPRFSQPPIQQVQPIVPDRQASAPIAAPSSLRPAESSRSLNLANGPSASADDRSVYGTSPNELRPIPSGGLASPRLDQGSAMTTGRAFLRPGAAPQRSSIPASFMDLANATNPSRPTVEQRNSYASSTFSMPLSPSSETPLSPSSETGEAEEARIHRKLLDLEITNKSLMAINSALEVTKLKQAKEIRELKRRLREGRGVDPVSRDSLGSTMFSDDEDLTESDAESDFMPRENPELEAAHQRCKDLVDAMVEQARKAILAEYDEPENTRGKVLHPVEVEEMRREAEEEGDETEADTTAASMTFDQTTGDDSTDDDGLPSSSSLKFEDSGKTDGTGLEASSSVSASEGVGQSSSETSLKQPEVGLHPNSAYGGYFPPNGDVSID